VSEIELPNNSHFRLGSLYHSAASLKFRKWNQMPNRFIKGEGPFDLTFMTFRLAFVKRLPGPTIFGVGKEFIIIFPSDSTTVYKAVKSN
jgi:hypothetical protein